MPQTYTRWLMGGSALSMAALGLSASFLPAEILLRLGAAPSVQLTLLVQILGALYLGFAMLNWMARFNLMGGIYSRPVAVGNLLHFAVVTIALLKVFAAEAAARAVWPLGIVYVGFAIGFAVVIFRHPVRTASTERADRAM